MHVGGSVGGVMGVYVGGSVGGVMVYMWVGLWEGQVDLGGAEKFAHSLCRKRNRLEKLDQKMSK